MEINKTENIYIRLLEGAETWVPVPVIKKGDDLFEIIENQFLDLDGDATSIWEFFPGDIVKGTIRKGDLVASELISFKFPGRKLHRLIFLIVKNLGEISLGQLQEFESEIKLLCRDKNIVQRQHPVVNKWLKKNCK